MMATTLTVSTRSSFSYELTGDPDIGSLSYSGASNDSQNYAQGTGADQANALFIDTRTITASGNDDLDLAGGLSNAFGTALTFTKIKYLEIRAAAGNTNNVVVGAAASNAWVGPFGSATDTMTIRPGGKLIIECQDSTGYAVTAGTGDILRIANSAGSTSVTYSILAVGVV